MADDTRDWENSGQEDSFNFDGSLLDPLSQLAADLAVCILYLEEGTGGFCDDCTCQLGFHCSAGEAGECELCACYGRHIKKVLEIPAAKTVYKKQHGLDLEAHSRIRDIEDPDDYDRAKEARKQLKELSD